jgi:hypothetical protein
MGASANPTGGGALLHRAVASAPHKESPVFDFRITGRIRIPVTPHPIENSALFGALEGLETREDRWELT